MIKQFVAITLAGLFVAGCESIATVPLESEEIHTRSPMDTLNDVAGLPYALPKTVLKIEVSHTKTDIIEKVRYEEIVTTKKEGESTTTETTTKLIDAPACPSYAFKTKVTPLHVADEEERYMLRMGELSPFSSRKMKLRVNSAGLLDTDFSRDAIGSIQSASNALVHHGAILEQSSFNDEAPKSPSGETSEAADTEDSLPVSLAQALAQRNMEQIDVSPNVSADGFASESSDGASLSRSIEVTKGSGVVFYCDAHDVSECTRQYIVGGEKLRRIGKDKTCARKLVSVTIQPAEEESPSPFQSNNEIAKESESRKDKYFRKGRGRVFYRIYKNQRFEILMGEKTCTNGEICADITENPAESSFPLENKYTAVFPVADRSNTYALQATDGILSGTGMRAAFMQGQLVGVSIDRPSPIVAVFTAPFEVIGAITSIPAVLASN